MVSEDFKLMESKSSHKKRIIQGVKDMVAATTEEGSHKMTVAEADALKMMSTMTEAKKITHGNRDERGSDKDGGGIAKEF